MPESEGFQERLESAVDEKTGFIESRRLPRLQEAFHVFQTAFENLRNVLVRKSLIREDPYKYAHELSEVTVPSREPFPESERQDKLSQRLSEFHSQLEFLNTTYQFRIEFLTLDRLKRLVGLIQYIQWQKLTESSSDPITEVLADCLARVRLGTDRISSGILTSCTGQLGKVVREIAGLLRELVDCQRERYKLVLRRDLLPRSASVLSRLYASAPDEAMRRLLGDFPRAVKGLPFYRELVHEMLEEEYGGDRELRRREALARLAIPEEQPEQAKPAPDFRAVLKDGIRSALASGRSLAEALHKLEENQGVLEGRQQDLSQRLRAWWERTRGRTPKSRAVRIQFLDDATGSPSGEQLDLTVFFESLRNKAGLFTALASGTHPSARCLETAGEGPLYEFLSRSVQDLQLIHRRLEGLDEHYKGEASQRERGRTKGIRIETSALKNSIVAANKRRHEYAARKEEREQLERLEGRQRDSSAPPAEHQTV